ncbi:MAG TPA: serine/threonine-protein kinase, partial [Planctomycetota bacterium]|nr:serine/threonine-protein kinase [Planctomycetota bacterium]
MAKRSQRLKFRLEDGTVHDCEVEAGVPFVIGRGKEANLHLDFKSVSRQHCQLELDPSSGEVFVIDLGSQNGTRLNGKRITRAPLATGDDLLVATVPVKVELARKPKPTIERQLSPSEKQLRDQLLELGLEVHERIELGSPVPIFLARRTDLEQEVLVKAVRLGAGRDADEKAQRLLREAKLAAKVRHRNVVQIYDV